MSNSASIFDGGTVIAIQEFVVVLCLAYVAGPVVIFLVRTVLHVLAWLEVNVLVVEETRRRVNAWLFVRTPVGFILDVVQAVLSLVSCVAFVMQTNIPLTSAVPDWARRLEIGLSGYFTVDWALRMLVTEDALRKWFTFESVVDFLTVVPVWTAMVTRAAGAIAENAPPLSRATGILRVFRALRILRLARLAPSLALERKLFLLALTVVSLVFVAAGLYHVLESLQISAPVSFAAALYRMTGVVVGRPLAPVPSDSDITYLFLSSVILLAATAIPAVVAQIVKLWLQSESPAKYRPSAAHPPVIVMGDVSPVRLRGFLTQYLHNSRDPSTVAPMVLLGSEPLTPQLRTLLDRHRYGHDVTFVRGESTRSVEALRRAGALGASTVIVLLRQSSHPKSADAEAVAAAFAAKQFNPLLRAVVQVRSGTTAKVVRSLPGWTASDDVVAVLPLRMALLAAGTILPGLAAFTTNLVHRGSRLLSRKKWRSRARGIDFVHDLCRDLNTSIDARLALPVRSWIESHTRRPPSGTIHREEWRIPTPWWWRRPGQWATAAVGFTPLEEYTRSFDQEVYEEPCPPGLDGLEPSAAARLLYLRHGLLLLSPPPSDPPLVYPDSKLLLVAPDQIDVARVRQLYRYSTTFPTSERFVTHPWPHLATSPSAGEMHILGAPHSPAFPAPPGGNMPELCVCGAPTDPAVEEEEPYQGHILVCGANAALGLLVGTLLEMGASRDILGPHGVTIVAERIPDAKEMEIVARDSSKWLRDPRVRVIEDDPRERTVLEDANVAEAVAAVVLSSLGGPRDDDYPHDVDAPVVAAQLHQLNPNLHLVTDLVDGAHAIYVEPVGFGLNEAVSGALMAAQAAARPRTEPEPINEEDREEEEVPDAEPTDTVDIALGRRDRLETTTERDSLLITDPMGVGSPSPIVGVESYAEVTHRQRQELRAAAAAARAEAVEEARQDAGANQTIAEVVLSPAIASARAAQPLDEEDQYGAPAFVSGRALGRGTLDSIICETNFSPHILRLVRGLIHAAKLGALRLLPAAQLCHSLPLLSSPLAPVATPTPTPHRSPTPVPAPPGFLPVTYGQLFEALLRSRKALALGIYRRVAPQGLAAPTGPASNSLGHGVRHQPWYLSKSALRRHEPALVTYTLANPASDLLLSVFDGIYVFETQK